MNQLRKISAAALLLFSMVGLSASHSAGAAQTPDGITVSPAFQQVTIPPGATDQPVSFTITNNRPVAQDLSLSVADFNTLNESGGLFFVGTNPTQLQKKYGLANWVSLPQDSLTLQPKQTVTINASILNQPTLQGGGHYGALMIALGGQESSSRIGIHPIASSLLFVTKANGATHDLTLSNLYSSHSLTSLPSKVTLRFKNDGNTHLVPRGVVTILGPQNKPVRKGIINQDSNIILPSTYRRFDVPLRIISHTTTPGSYKIKVDFRYDGIDIYRSYQQSFTYVPVLGLVIVVVILLAIGVLIYKLVLRPNK